MKKVTANANTIILLIILPMVTYVAGLSHQLDVRLARVEQQLIDQKVMNTQTNSNPLQVGMAVSTMFGDAIICHVLSPTCVNVVTTGDAHSQVHNSLVLDQNATSLQPGQFKVKEVVPAPTASDEQSQNIIDQLANAKQQHDAVMERIATALETIATEIQGINEPLPAVVAASNTDAATAPVQHSPQGGVSFHEENAPQFVPPATMPAELMTDPPHKA